MKFDVMNEIKKNPASVVITIVIALFILNFLGGSISPGIGLMSKMLVLFMAVLTSYMVYDSVKKGDTQKIVLWIVITIILLVVTGFLAISFPSLSVYAP